MEERMTELYTVSAKTMLISSRGRTEPYKVRLTINENGLIIYASDFRGNISVRMYVLLSLLASLYQIMEIPFTGKTQYIRYPGISKPSVGHHPALKVMNSGNVYRLDQCVPISFIKEVPILDVMSMMNFIYNLPQENHFIYQKAYDEQRAPYTVLRDVVHEAEKWDIQMTYEDE